MVDAPKPLGSQPPGPDNWEVSPPDGPMAPSGPASQSPELANPAADFVPSAPPASSAARYAVELTVNPGDGTPATSGEDGDRATPDNAPDTAAGDAPNGPPDPPDAPPRPDQPEEDPLAEKLAAMGQSLHESTNIVVTALETGPYPRYADDGALEEVLANITEAVAFAEGPEAGRNFLRQTAERIHAPPSKTVEAWTRLYADGDPAALPEARRAIALASEELTARDWDLEEGESLGGLASAERLVRLVEAGDASSLEQAKAMAHNTPLRDRAVLLARLYANGDSDLYDSALKTVRSAITAEIESGEADFRQADYALSLIAHAAVAENRPTRALRAADSLFNEEAKVEVHARLYEAGHTRSLIPLERYLAQDVTRENAEFARKLQLRLAVAGHPLSRAFVESRVEQAEINNDLYYRTGIEMPDYVEKQVADLEVMHKLGSATAADSMVRLARSASDIFAIPYLVRVGRAAEAEALALKINSSGFSPTVARTALSFQHDTTLWRRLIDTSMKGHYLDHISELTRELGLRIRNLRNPEG